MIIEYIIDGILECHMYQWVADLCVGDYLLDYGADSIHGFAFYWTYFTGVSFQFNSGNNLV